MNDLRFALRQLAKQPAFSLIAILALGLGIGANTAIFSVVNAVLLRPLPYKAPEQIVSLWGTNPKDEIKQEVASLLDFTDWRQQAQSFEALAGFSNTMRILARSDGEPERLSGASVVGDFFAVLGIEPAIGRKFLPQELQEGGPRATILSHALWQRRFGGEYSIIGQQITLSGNQHTVVGVMPPGFQDPAPNAGPSIDFWVPLVATDNPASWNRMRTIRRLDFLSTIARLKPEVSIKQAQAEMKAIAARLEKQFPDSNTGWSVAVEPLAETLTGDIRPALLVLLGAVGFLLLIACANVANLLLARASARRREFAVRSALGASRSRIVRQLLTENVLLSVIGATAGLVFAWWGMRSLLAVSPGNIPRLSSIGIDAPVMLFTLAVSLLTAVLFGLAPALTVSNLNLNDTLKEGGRSAAEGAGGRRLRSALAIVEIALSVMLLIGAGLLIRSFLRLQEVRPGFNPNHLLAAELALPTAKYAEDQQVTNFYTELLERLEHQPGVQAVAVTTTLPLAGQGDLLYFRMEGRDVALADRQPDAEVRTVNANYFRTMEIPLRRGRLLADDDSIDTVVINEALARKYFPNDDPIGKRITFNSAKNPNVKWSAIVGVVGDVRQSSLASEPYTQIYGSYRKAARRSLTVVLRTAGDPKLMANTLRQQVWSLDREQPLYNIRTVDQVLASSVARSRFNTMLITILASVALVLAAVGIYGVISYSVTQRTHEIGVRMALGATAGNVLRLVVGHGLLIASIGLAVGVAAALAVTRIMSTLLFGVSAADPLTYVALVLLLGIIAMIASYIPARRATHIDPVIALRHE